jgi:tRNAThr (cytosine32-N3)-methyltransferase
MRAHESYDTNVIRADEWDVAGNEMPPGLEEGSVDVALMIFVFSALSPPQWKKAVENVHRVLKPGGEVCFRDYGRGDLAQVRFKKGRYLEENFYVRGDGTRVYFFDKEELARIWAGCEPETEDTWPHFVIESLGVDHRLIVNRARKLQMHRCWLQGRFRKKRVNPDTAEEERTPEDSPRHHSPYSI